MSNNFTDEVTKHIKNKTAKQLIEAELSSHILDRIDYYVELGYTKEQAEQKATEDMGDPEQTALPLGSLHDIKWYKKRENIVAIVLNAVLIIAVNYLHTTLLYDNSLLSLVSILYSPMPYYATHHLYMDLISLGVFIITLFVVILARKNRSKFIAGLSAVPVLIQIIFPPYQPMLYSVAKVVTSGLGGYTDSIFSYNYIEDNIKPIISIGSLIISLILLGLCIYIFTGIYLQERGKSTRRLWKPYNIFRKILICFLTLNIVLISVCTAVAYVNLDEKIAEIREMNRREIEFVVNTSIADKEIDELKQEIENAGLSQFNTTDLYADYQSQAGSSYIVAYCEPDSKVIILDFAVTTSSKIAPINRDIYLHESEFDIFKDKMDLQDFGEDDEMFADVLIYSTSDAEIPLADFMDGELYQYAVSVQKTIHTDYDEPTENECEEIRFSFLLESDEYRSVAMVFTDGYLTELQLWKI